MVVGVTEMEMETASHPAMAHHPQVVMVHLQQHLPVVTALLHQAAMGPHQQHHPAATVLLHRAAMGLPMVMEMVM